MPEFTFLQDLLILLGLALANAMIFNRLRQSPIIGYLVTGMLAGPYGFHLIQAVHEVELLAEIGVIMLLFTIGLEFSFSRILRLRGLILKCGTAQIALTALAVFALGRLLGLPPATATTLGMAMALSSTAIVLKLLLERGEIDSAHGRLSLAILLCQDLCVIFFIVALPLLAGGGNDLSPWGVVRAIALLAGLGLFSRHLLQPLLRAILRTRAAELFRLTVLALALGTAWVTAQAGLSLALGAFLAGLALAESDYSHQVLADILPFRDTFLAFFFISMGMLVNVQLLIDNGPAVLGLLLVIALLKISTGTLASLFSPFPFRVALTTGLILFQVGEFAFILLKMAMDLELMTTQVYQMALSVIALTMMATPVLLPRAAGLAAGAARLLGASKELPPADSEERTRNLEGHVIIGGYGLTGRNVARVLRTMALPYIHVELNGEAVRRARAKGEFIVYGDVTSATVLEGLNIEKARALVLAINDPAALARAISAARDLNPGLYILARTRFVAELDHLQRMGADEVIPDEFEASLQLSAFLLRRFAIPEGQTLKLLASLRTEHYSSLRQEALAPTSLSGYLSVLESGHIEFQAVPDDSPCLGKSLAELDFRNRTGATVVGLIRQERVTYGPMASLRLEPGDTLLLLGSTDHILEARELLHGHPV